MLDQGATRLLPAAHIPRPTFGKTSASSQIRQRRRWTLGTWRSANKLVAAMKGFERGQCGTTT